MSGFVGHNASLACKKVFKNTFLYNLEAQLITLLSIGKTGLVDPVACIAAIAKKYLNKIRRLA